MAIPLLRFFFRTAKKGTKPPFTVLCPRWVTWEIPSALGGCTFGGRALPPGLFGASSETGPFAWELLRSPSASPERSLPKQNYFFISKIENYRKSFIHADLPLFCTFPKFFPKSKIGRQILPQIFSNFPKWIFPISPHFGCKIFDSQQGMCRKSWCWHQKRASSQGSSWGNIFCCNVSPQGEFRQLYKFNAL